MKGLFSGGAGGRGGGAYLRYLLEFGKNMRDLYLQGIGKMFVEPFLSVADFFALVGGYVGWFHKKARYLSSSRYPLSLLPLYLTTAAEEWLLQWNCPILLF